MFERIRQLRNKGYVPDIVFDIGAYHGHWTNEMHHIYPDATFFLYEAIDYKELSSRYLSTDKIHVFPNTLLNDDVGDVVWYQNKNTGDSMFREKTIYYKECEEIVRRTTTLEKHLSENNHFDILDIECKSKIFIKIDTQGSEIPILKGGMEIAKKADFILLEVPFFGQYNTGVPSFSEHVQFMESIGFIPYDIVEKHYCNDFTIQLDILLIRKDHSFVDTINQILK